MGIWLYKCQNTKEKRKMMPKTLTVETVVRDVVNQFVSKNQPFNLQSVIQSVKDFATDDVERAMLKAYFVGIVGPNPTISNFAIHTIGGKIAFAPETMNEKEVEKTLKSTNFKTSVKPKSVKAVKSKVVPKQMTLPSTRSVRKNYVSDFYSPDKRGRIRIPVKMIWTLGLEPKTKAFVRVNSADNSFVVTANSRQKNVKSYTIDRYGNLLFPVNEPTKNYRLSVVRGRVVARPIEA